MKNTERIFYALLILLLDFVVFFLPLAAVLIAYVLLVRPPWIPELVEKIYRDPS
ncbi:MAG: hypothetical protein OEN50_12055 [Deltaproteobacteria bacterium]|nr:hypothetical protein [Deltaproteobacteria bacterium]